MLQSVQKWFIIAIIFFPVGRLALKPPQTVKKRIVGVDALIDPIVKCSEFSKKFGNPALFRRADVGIRPYEGVISEFIDNLKLRRICLSKITQGGHIMPYKIGILCAGDKEAEPFYPHIENPTYTKKAMLNFCEGTIHGINTVLLFSGTCKVNAAIAAQILIDHFGVDIILNSGTAGGIDPKLNLFDTVIATESVYHDVAKTILTEFHPWMDTFYFPCDSTLLRLSHRAVEKLDLNTAVYWGRMATGEAFITDDGRDTIIQNFDPLTVDMETAAIAHVCYVNSIPFLAIRNITDTADHSGSGYFHENCPKSSAIAKDITLALLEEIQNAQ